MTNVLAFAEQRDGQVGSAAREAVGVAAQLAESLGGKAHALVLGGSGLSASAAALGAVGAAVVAVGEHDDLSDYNPEGYVNLVVDHVRAGDYGAVIFGRPLWARIWHLGSRLDSTCQWCPT